MDTSEPITEDEQPTMSRKRRVTSGEEPQQKKPKKSNLDAKLAEAITVAQTKLKKVKKLFSFVKEYKFAILLQSILEDWEEVLEDAEIQRPVVEPFPSKFPTTFAEGVIYAQGVEQFTGICHKANSAIEDFLTVYSKLRDLRPSPSSMARKWAEPQERFDDLLCARPVKRTGLPLITLHNAFRKYRRRLSEPLPESANVAHRVACLLGAEMGNSFKDERARTEAFEGCIKELFPDWSHGVTYSAATESTLARIDAVLTSHQDQLPMFPLLFREDKLELGDGGDVYVQLSRNYQIWIRSLQGYHNKNTKKFLNAGAPVFLLYLVGPTVGVAGAFYDGKSCIIEPLGPVCWMLEDVTGDRQMALAKFFFALDHGVRDLQTFQASLTQAQERSYPPGVPREYHSFKALSNTAHSLPSSFLDHAKPASISTRHLSFVAEVTIGDRSNQPVLIKMVRETYGEEVHTMLAASGYAPTLYGMFEEEDLPTLYVMERLSDDWITLFDFEQRMGTNCGAYLGGIRCTLDSILDCLEANNMVHGDMRTNNIMIEVKENIPTTSLTDQNKVNLTLVDFDWAGKAGQVCYPFHRNNDIEGIRWPGNAGEAIKVGHDRQLSDSWWELFGKSVRQPSWSS